VVDPQMPGDRGLGPTSCIQRLRFHSRLPCEHPFALSRPAMYPLHCTVAAPPPAGWRLRLAGRCAGGRGAQLSESINLERILSLIKSVAGRSSRRFGLACLICRTSLPPQATYVGLWARGKNITGRLVLQFRCKCRSRYRLDHRLVR